MSSADITLAQEVDFSIIRYAQCWEDADTVLEALDIKPGDCCLSIASAGDNTLSLLTRDPSRVVAVDLSPAQMACLELRVAAYRELSHAEFLELMGARPSERRRSLYGRLRPGLSPSARQVWDAQRGAIERGIGSAGKFEHYLDIIRRIAINLTHSRAERDALFVHRSTKERQEFYNRHWNNRRWRLLIRLLCSKVLMGRLGRDPRFFKYAKGSVADHVTDIVQDALVNLDPADNPYAYWIAHGRYGQALPHALRPENFGKIRDNLNCLEWHITDIQSFLDDADENSIDRFNLSDIFEYLSEAESARVFEAIARAGRPGGRLAYWSMLVERYPPESLREHIVPMPDFSRKLHRRATTFFYSDFIVHEIT